MGTGDTMVNKIQGPTLNEVHFSVLGCVCVCVFVAFGEAYVNKMSKIISKNNKFYERYKTG